MSELIYLCHLLGEADLSKRSMKRIDEFLASMLKHRSCASIGRLGLRDLKLYTLMYRFRCILDLLIAFAALLACGRIFALRLENGIFWLLESGAGTALSCGMGRCSPRIGLFWGVLNYSCSWMTSFIMNFE